LLIKKEKDIQESFKQASIAITWLGPFPPTCDSTFRYLTLAITLPIFMLMPHVTKSLFLQIGNKSLLEEKN